MRGADATSFVEGAGEGRPVAKASPWDVLGTATMPESMAFRLDPFGSFPEGAFIDRSARPEPVVPQPFNGHRDLRYVFPLRHLPTSETVDAVLARFPCREAKKLMVDWLLLWVGIAEAHGRDVDRLAARLEVPSWTPSLAPDDLADLRARLEEGKGRMEEAYALFTLEHATRRPQSRDPVLHALEDAALAVALTRSGVRWGCVHTLADRPVLLTPCRAPSRRVARLPRRAGERLVRDLTWSPQYWRTKAFQSVATRMMREARTPLHAACALLDLAKQGHRKAFLKACATKAGTWTVDLEEVATIGDAIERLVAAMGYMAWQQTDRGGFVVVQEFRRFVAEHRFFVVDGRVVASTPSDRSMSVLDAHGGKGRLDPRVATLARPPGRPGPYDRGVTGHRTDRSTVARMARVVRALACRLRDDPSGSRAFGFAYVVDVGVDETDRVEVIEVNRYRHVGLYGVDCGRVVARLTGLPDAAAPPSNEGWTSTRRMHFVVHTVEAARHRAETVATGGWEGADW